MDFDQVMHVRLDRLINWTKYTEVPVEQVEVLRLVSYWPGKKIVSDMPWLPLEEVVMNAEESAWPKRKSQRPRQGRPGRGKDQRPRLSLASTLHSKWF